MILVSLHSNNFSKNSKVNFSIFSCKSLNLLKALVSDKFESAGTFKLIDFFDLFDIEVSVFFIFSKDVSFFSEEVSFFLSELTVNADCGFSGFAYY